MALTLSDVEKIAKLSRLHLSSEEQAQILRELNDVFTLVENMQTVKNEERSCVIWDTIRILFKGK